MKKIIIAISLVMFLGFSYGLAQAEQQDQAATATATNVNDGGGASSPQGQKISVDTKNPSEPQGNVAKPDTSEINQQTPSDAGSSYVVQTQSGTSSSTKIFLALSVIINLVILTLFIVFLRKFKYNK